MNDYPYDLKSLLIVFVLISGLAFEKYSKRDKLEFVVNKAVDYKDPSNSINQRHREHVVVLPSKNEDPIDKSGCESDLMCNYQIESTGV